mgnify:CR=1 FL=1
MKLGKSLAKKCIKRKRMHNKAEQLLREHKKAFMPMQFDNAANPEIHKLTTAEAFVEANPIDRRIYDIPDAGFGFVTTGKGHLDLMEALRLLGLDECSTYVFAVQSTDASSNPVRARVPRAVKTPSPPRIENDSTLISRCASTAFPANCTCTRTGRTVSAWAWGIRCWPRGWIACTTG